jgi:hypothetical protein
MAVVLNERIDKTRACYLLETFKFENFMTIYDGNKSDAKKEYDKIIKYLNMKVNTNNNYVKYNYCDKRHNGRLYGKDSIQGIKREIRGFICDGITYDIDIVNAHPIILLQLCLKYEFHCPNLKQYTSERKQCLNSIMADDNISYEEAKKIVLVATNDNKKLKTNNAFLKAYDKEMKTIQKKFLELEDFSYVKEYAKKETNFEGSFINHILCIHENYVLEAMRTFSAINELEIHSLMFDGFQLYSMNEHTLKLMKEYIHKHTDFVNIELIIKEHSYDFEMPVDFKPKERTVYEDVRSDFEKTNCKVGAEFVCDLHNDFNVYSDHTFKVLHNELTYIGSDGKEENFINTWYKDKDKRKYDKYDSYPKDNLCPKYVYNMWEKFPVELMPSVTNDYISTGLKWFLNHIDVLTNYNEEHSNFVKMWLAQMFQYPEHKSVFLMFVGKEGSGKGTFIRFLETIMGGSNKCWSCADPQEQIFGKFNDMMKKAFLVILDEADKSATYNSISKFKYLITEPTITINPKGKTSFVMNSYHRYLGFSNNPDPSVKLKRRDFTFRMSDCKINDTTYFNDGNLYANDLGCCKAIYDYFMRYPTKPKINDNDLPVGNYNEMLKENQKDVITEFMEDFVYLHNGTVKFFNIELYERFLDFCKRNYIQEKNILNKHRFGIDLQFKNYNGVIKSEHKGLWINGKSSTGWTFDFDILKLQFEGGVSETMSMDSDDEVIE